MTIQRSLRQATVLGLLSAVGVGLTGCGDELLTESPKDILVPENLYTSPAGFRNGLNGLYQNVRQERATYSGSSPRTVLWQLGVDNGWSNFRGSRTDIFNDWGTTNHSQYPGFIAFWELMYQTINNANAIAGRAEDPDLSWSEEEKNAVIAEARLIRAWAYRHLVYLFGPVPITLEESSGAEIRTDWERAPTEAVWDQVEQDLLFAEQHLTDPPAVDGRVSRAVAQHYLAELYLLRDLPEQAEAKAAAITGNGAYALVTSRYGVEASEPGVPFMDQFKEGNSDRAAGNTEALWVLQFANNVTGGGSHIMRRGWVNRYYNIPGMQVSEEFGGRGISRLAPTKWSLDLYHPEDDRGSMHALRLFYTYNNPGTLPEGAELGDTIWTVAEEEDFFQELWPTTRKWDHTDPLNPAGSPAYNDVIYLRLAETYLLLAEAQMKQGRVAEAANAINALRDRAGAPRVSAAEIDLDFILDERSRELLAEEQRRYTLLRTHTWLERTRLYNPIAGPNIVERDTIYPIPQAVLDANIGAQMPQNPGY